MSLTSLEKVQDHLVTTDYNATNFLDKELFMNANGKVSLGYSGIVTDSEKVKIMYQNEPINQGGLILNAETWISLNHEDLLPLEVALVNETGFSTVYQQDTDYCFNPIDGEIRRIAGGSIADGGVAEVYYNRYRILIKDVDYNINYSTGEIDLITGGKLNTGSVIWVDFERNSSTETEDLINQAITEAEYKISQRLKEEYSLQSSDQGLITGATELALSIVCRGLAAMALNDGASAAENRSRGWRTMALQYEKLAWTTLRPFLASPSFTVGKSQSNTSWEWQ